MQSFELRELPLNLGCAVEHAACTLPLNGGIWHYSPVFGEEDADLSLAAVEELEVELRDVVVIRVFGHGRQGMAFIHAALRFASIIR